MFGFGLGPEGEAVCESGECDGLRRGGSEGDGWEVKARDVQGRGGC